MTRGILIAVVLTAAVGCKKEEETKKETATEQAAHDGHDHAAHGHGAPRKKRIDPGPRLIALADRLAEESAAAREIGPDKPDGYWGQVVDNEQKPGTQSIVLSHAAEVPEELRGATMPLCGQADVMVTRSRPHALSALEMNFRNQVDTEAMHAQMDHAIHQHCMQQVADDLYEQKGIVLDKDLAFQMVLHATVKNGKAVIDDVEADWPEEVVSDAQSCFVSAFRGVEYETKADKSYSFTWPVCITVGGKTAANDNAAPSAGGDQGVGS